MSPKDIKIRVRKENQTKRENKKILAEIEHICYVITFVSVVTDIRAPRTIIQYLDRWFYFGFFRHVQKDVGQ